MENLESGLPRRRAARNDGVFASGGENVYLLEF